MLIDCPACARSYHVSRAEIGEGREVICPRCEARWHVDSVGTSSAPAASNDLLTHAVSRRPAIPHDDLAEAARPRVSVWRRVRPLAAAAACLALATGLIAARERIVRLEPRFAGVYARIGLPVNVRGLAFAGIVTKRTEGPDLTISGEIRNVAQRRVGVPRLRYEVRDATGEAVASWTESAPGRTLATGKTLAFVSSPHPVPPEGRTILVRFETDEAAPPTFRLARKTL